MCDDDDDDDDDVKLYLYPIVTLCSTHVCVKAQKLELRNSSKELIVNCSLMITTSLLVRK